VQAVLRRCNLRSIDILQRLKTLDSYRVQQGIAALLDHLGGFLLLIPYIRIHFTG